MVTKASKARYGRYIRPSNQGSLWDNLQHSKEVKGPESKEDVSPWRRVDSQDPPDWPRSLTVDTRQLEEHPRCVLDQRTTLMMAENTPR